MEAGVVEKEKEVVRKALDVLKEKLSVEEYARFLAAITPQAGGFRKGIKKSLEIGKPGRNFSRR